MIRFSLSLFIVLSFFLVDAQVYFPLTYRHLEWKQFESVHATIIYHDPLEKKARQMAAVYDQVYQAVCDVYGYAPKRQTVILKDTDDYSNGAAYFFDDKIEIYATSLDFPFRGNHRWMEDVISHEFTHIVQIQSAMKWFKEVPAIYFQWFGYEDVRRPDILYGYPNQLVSLPILNITIPAWLAEGTAQFNVPGLYHDFWDSHRDMILRARTLDSTLLSFREMMSFNKTSLDGETVYNQGFHMVSWLEKRYGPKSMKKLNESLRMKSVWSIESAMEEAFGSDGYALYDEWKKDIRSYYESQIAPILPELDNGQSVLDDGFSNWADDYDPESGEILLRSNRESDYLGMVQAVLLDSSLNEVKSITDVRSNSRMRLVTHAGKRGILYSAMSLPDKFQSRWSDLYWYDFKSEKVIRLTEGARLFSPVYAGNGKVFAIRNLGAVKTVIQLQLPDSLDEDFQPVNDFETLIENPDDYDYHTLDYHAGLNRLAGDRTRHHGREVYTYDLSSRTLTPVKRVGTDEREPRWLESGSLIVTNDQTGIFNLYELNPETGERLQKTQVSGGAFQALPLDSNRWLLSVFTGTGYKTRMIQPVTKTLKPATEYPFENHPEESFDDLEAGLLTVPESYYPEAGLFRPRPQSYPMTFYPVVRVDSYTQPGGQWGDLLTSGDFKGIGENLARDTKLGTYFFSTDKLEWLQFSGGILAAPGSDASLLEWDRDIYFGITLSDPFFKKFRPVRWGIDYYNLSRLADDAVNINIGLDSAITDAVYNLNLIEFYSQWYLSPANFLTFRYSYSFYSSKIRAFFWQPVGALIPGSDQDYYKGTSLSLNWQVSFLQPTREREINPIGRELSLTLASETNNLLYDFGVDNGILVPKYEKYPATRVSFGYKEFIPLWFSSRHTINLWLRGASTSTSGNESFFYHYAGGLTGMRGYPFYSIGGYHMAHAQLAYRFPLIESIEKSIGPWYFDRLYGNIFANTGQAWTWRFPGSDKLLNDIGYELRMETSAFYLMPIRIFFSGAYGLNKQTVPLRAGFLTRDGRSTVTYGNEWLYYFGMLFNFDLGLEKR